jgi:hypothetical protein
MCFRCSDSGNFQGKSTNKKESGTQGYTSSWSSASGVANTYQTPHRFPLERFFTFEMGIGMLLKYLVEVLCCVLNQLIDFIFYSYGYSLY